ncbi:hypothetical protein ES707_12525 [subsurface metagenome]
METAELLKDPRYLRRKMEELLTRRGKILDRAVHEGRDLSEAEKRHSETLQNSVDRYQNLLSEAQDEELKRAGIPRSQGNIGAALRGSQGEPGNGLSFGPGETTESRSGFLLNEYQSEHRNIGQLCQDARWPEMRERRGFSMEIGEEGGFLVPDLLAERILRVGPESSVVRPRCTKIPPDSLHPDAKTGIPTVDSEEGVLGGLQVSWLAEGAEKPEIEKPKLVMVELEPMEVAAHCTVSDKLLRNASAVSIFLESVFRSALYAEEDYQCIQGDGVGKPLGFLNSAAKILVPRDTATTFKFADVAQMMTVFYYSSWSSAVWLINHSVMAQLIEMVDAGSHRVFIGSDPSKLLPPSLLGIPVVFSDRNPVLGATGDVCLLDLGFYLLKNGAGPFIRASEHMRFTENLTVIKMWYGCDGSPWLRKPILMKDGVTKRSPFIILAA